MNQARTGGSAELKFAKSAYWYFLFWGVCSALGTTLCTLVDAILVAIWWAVTAWPPPASPRRFS